MNTKETKVMTEPQANNACTLISVGMISGILSKSLPAKAFTDARTEYLHGVAKEHILSDGEIYARELARSRLSGGYDRGLGQGYTARQAAAHYAKTLTLDRTIDILPPQPLDVHQVVSTFITERKAIGDEPDVVEMLLDGGLRDLLFRAIEAKTDGGLINYLTASKAELLEFLEPIISSDASPSVEAQVKTEIEGMLDPSGSILTIGIHTISVTKKDNVYFCFNSTTLKLTETTDPDVVVAYVIDVHQPTDSILIAKFTPKPAPVLDASGFVKTSKDKEIDTIIDKYLKILQNKIAKFQKKSDSGSVTGEKYHAACQALVLLKGQIKGLKDAYHTKSYDDNCITGLTGILDAAVKNPAIKTHRGWIKQFCIDLVTAVAVVLTGILPGVLLLARTRGSRDGRFFPETNTDTVNIVKTFINDLEKKKDSLGNPDTDEDLKPPTV